MNFLGRLFGRRDADPIVIPDSDLTDQQKGTYARQLQTNPLWVAMMDTLEAEAFKLWANTNIDDIEQREYLYKHFQIVKLIRRRVGGYISNAAINEDVETRELRKVVTRNPGRR